MEKMLVFGHKNPDTDSIASSIAYADLKEQLGFEVEAVRLGDINKETQFALEYFKIDQPRYIESVDEGVNKVILVDHNEFQQSVNNIKDVQIVEVIDHHRVANFETAQPLYFRVEPVGCTATIIKKMYEENNIVIPEKIAGLLLSAIISDSLLLKSPTCTKEDVDAAHALSLLANVELDSYGLDMLEAGTNLKGKTIPELITMDSKEFMMGDVNVEIAQINAINTGEVYKDQAALEEAIETVIMSKDLKLFLLVVTDIINSNSDILALGDAQGNVEKAFNIKLENNRAILKGVVSRKKQIVTHLTEAFIK